MVHVETDKSEILTNFNLLKAIVETDLKFNSEDAALCPFHEEKTPSFRLYKTRAGKAHFHCFGCEADGDIFTYLWKKRGMRLEDSLKMLGAVADQPNQLSSLTKSTKLVDTPFCEQDCQKYADLQEDYHILLIENQALRAKLGLGPFAVGEKL